MKKPKIGERWKKHNDNLNVIFEVVGYRSDIDVYSCKVVSIINDSYFYYHINNQYSFYMINSAIWTYLKDQDKCLVY